MCLRRLGVLSLTVESQKAMERSVLFHADFIDEQLGGAEYGVHRC